MKTLTAVIVFTAAAATSADVIIPDRPDPFLPAPTLLQISQTDLQSGPNDSAFTIYGQDVWDDDTRSLRISNVDLLATRLLLTDEQRPLFGRPTFRLHDVAPLLAHDPSFTRQSVVRGDIELNPPNLFEGFVDLPEAEIGWLIETTWTYDGQARIGDEPYYTVVGVPEPAGIVLLIACLSGLCQIRHRDPSTRRTGCG